MNWDITLKVIPIVVSLVALGVSSWVAVRDRARPKLIVRRGKGSDFSPEQNLANDREVLAIQVINEGRRPFALAATNPLRLIRDDGSIMPIPDKRHIDNDWTGTFTYTYGRPDDGRLCEYDGFVVTIPQIEWMWFRIGGAPRIVAVQVMDVTGRVRARRKLPRPLADWFNQDLPVRAVQQEIRVVTEGAAQHQAQEYE